MILGSIPARENSLLWRYSNPRSQESELSVLPPCCLLTTKRTTHLKSHINYSKGVIGLIIGSQAQGKSGDQGGVNISRQKIYSIKLFLVHCVLQKRNTQIARILSITLLSIQYRYAECRYTEERNLVHYSQTHYAECCFQVTAINFILPSNLNTDKHRIYHIYLQIYCLNVTQQVQDLQMRMINYSFNVEKFIKNLSLFVQSLN